jgi:3-hydroxyacyl-CoA dehydrogenase
VLRELDQIIKPDALLASNTSYLDLNELANSTTRPQSIVGMHFFSPANVMKLLEVIRGARTSPQALKTALLVGRRIGKIAVVSGVGEGFIGNRIYNAYRIQCELMLEDGCLPQEVDAALEEFGFAMGPFAVGDLSGLDIAAANRKRRRAAGLSAAREVPVLEELVEIGRLGRKVGRGWYDYPDSARRGVPDSAVQGLILAASKKRGLARKMFTPGEIQTRALATIVNEAALVIAEGTAARPSDIDLVFAYGYGFPAWRGGPLFWASKQPRQVLDDEMDTITADPATGFKRGNLDFIFD